MYDYIDRFFDNIGSKIKALATFLFVLLSALSIGCGIYLIIEDSTVWLILVILGPVLSWVSSFLLYGFGELIEKNQDTEYNTRELLRIAKEAKDEQKENKPDSSDSAYKCFSGEEEV